MVIQVFREIMFPDKEYKRRIVDNVTTAEVII
jgi:hypothetical protein